MALIFRRRKKLGKNSWVNISKRGASISKKAGLVTVNSRGKVRVRLAKGISFKL